MKLFLIQQTEDEGYDTYDSAVVAAETEEQARGVHPARAHDSWDNVWSGWCKTAEAVKVTYLGEAKPETPEGVICASYNAG